MNNVDRRDHLSHLYNFDGGMWRDRKWWMPIWKELFKSSCDQGYVLYLRVCEIAEEKRQAEEKQEQAAAAARGRGRGRGQGGGRGGGAGRRGGQAGRGLGTAKPIKPMTHLDFLEKIAEGFVVEAYNSRKDSEEDFLLLDAYDLDRLEQALDELRGDAPPSSRASGLERDKVTPSKKKRKTQEVCAPSLAARRPPQPGQRTFCTQTQAVFESDGRLALSELEGDEKHSIVSGQDAVDMGLIKEGYRKNSMFCAYRHCQYAADNKEMKSGAGIKAGMKQAPRSKAQTFCPHPRCLRAYHPMCFSIVHRLRER